MKLKAVDVIREIRDRSFEKTCQMRYEERLDFIRHMAEKTDQRMEDAGYLIVHRD
jgi:hypothetical protein